MAEMIMNEREWIEQAIAAQSLGHDPAATLSRLARYYYAQGYKKKDIVRMLEVYLVRCNPYASLEGWSETLEYYAKTCDKYPLIQIESIDITQRELDTIAGIDSVMLRKLLFTLLCFAKYNNLVNARNRNWVHQDFKMVFAYANITVSSKRKVEMINKLWTAGHLRFSHIVDNTNLNVIIVDSESDPALRITDMRNLGNQYLRYIGEPYFECEECGAVIKRVTNNQKYCKTCYAELNAQRAQERYHEMLLA